MNPEIRLISNVNRLLPAFPGRGKLGMKSGQGFYSYPHPEYARPDFLKRS